MDGHRRRGQVRGSAAPAPPPRRRSPFFEWLGSYGRPDLNGDLVAGLTVGAMLIGASQLKHLLGIKLEHTERVHEIVWEAVGRLHEIRLPTLAVGLAGIALLVAVKRWRPNWPGALIVVGLATAAVSLLGL